ncbi:MAG: 50S ribosomal protein L9 [SAR202 cluster bacterium Casp-Chloro-G4]|nr:50S ribosomal protein L9 [Chloroflexota bacterium]PKB61246.1 MAG: 50S ribosomal protein L9 [SAR202 cluster bacterium Casp-Chloro-G4]
MKVVFLEDVEGVAMGGEVKEVKNGFARNYLIPKNLAVPATHNALQRVQGLAVQADNDRVKMLTDMRELANHLEGVRVDVQMRAGATGQLYGSVTNAMVAERLFELTEREIDRRVIEIAEPIRDLGRFEVNVRLHADVQAQIGVLVYPIGKEADEFAQSLLDAEAKASEAEAAEALIGQAVAPTDAPGDSTAEPEEEETEPETSEESSSEDVSDEEEETAEETDSEKE